MNTLRHSFTILRAQSRTVRSPCFLFARGAPVSSTVSRHVEQNRLYTSAPEPSERNDVAATWQSRAGLEPSKSGLHADIWERWSALAMTTWRAAGFDRSKTWREQDVGLRKRAFEEFRAMIEEDEEMNKFPVLMQDDCMRFKMRRLHLYLTKEMERRQRLVDRKTVYEKKQTTPRKRTKD